MSDTAVATAPDFEVLPEAIRASYSSLTLHRKCPQAWLYRYEFGLRRPLGGPQPELDFGSWWGAMVGADALDRGKKLDSLRVPPRTLRPVDSGPEFDQATMTVMDVLNACIHWWGTRDADTQDAWVDRLGDTAPRRLRDSYVRWRDEWAEDRKHEHPLGLEVKWRRSLPRPASDRAWETSDEAASFDGMPPIELTGAVDQVFFDDRRGLVVVSDDKTKRSLDSQTSLDDMMDSQLQVYTWGVEPVLAAYGIDSPRAVRFDRIRSVRPSTPSMTASGGLSKAATLYDLRTYRAWAAEDTRPDEEAVAEIIAGLKDGDGLEERQALVREAVAEPGRIYGSLGEFFVTGAKKGLPKFGRYEEDPKEIDRLSAEAHRRAFFQRTLTPVSRNLVRAHLRAAVDTASDIARTMRRSSETGETGRNLVKMGCSFCEYQQLCRAQMVSGPDGEYELAQFGLAARDGRTALEWSPAQ